jgi:hypothetical protein
VEELIGAIVAAEHHLAVEDRCREEDEADEDDEDEDE